MRAVQAWSTERVQKPINESYCSVIQICVLITSRMVDSLETTSRVDQPWYLRDRRFVGCSFWATVWNLAESCTSLGFLYLVFILSDPNTLSEMQCDNREGPPSSHAMLNLWDNILRARYNYKGGINRNCDKFVFCIATYIRVKWRAGLDLSFDNCCDFMQVTDCWRKWLFLLFTIAHIIREEISHYCLPSNVCEWHSSFRKV